MKNLEALIETRAATNLIIVMGVSGSGKSTLAEALGHAYNYQYLDGDDFHSDESRSLMAAGIPLTDEHRAPWVARIKQRLINNSANQTHTVLAFSGLKQKHRKELRSAGLNTIFLFLSAEKAIIQERLNNRSGHFMPPSLLDNQIVSLECPLSETDVYQLDVGLKPSAVIEQAKSIINNKLLIKTSVA